MTALAIDAATASVPPAWKHHRFKALVHRRDERVGDQDAQMLSLASAGHLYPRSGVGDRQQASDESLPRYLMTYENDLVINPMWLTGGSVAVSNLSGAVSPDYRVFTAGPLVWPRFLHHLLRSDPYRRQYDLFVRANTTFDRRIQQIDLDGMPVFVPSVDYQRRIADFLDDKVTRIDNIIAARHKQMSLGRLALSHKVDSAFAYLAASTVRAGRVLDVLPGYTFPSDGFTDEDDAIRLLRGTNVGVGHVNWSETVRWPVSRTGGLKPFELKVGDVVMGMDRPWIKSGLRIAEIKAEDLPALLLQRVLKFKPGPLVRPRFLYWAYQSADFRNGVESELTGLSVPHLSGDQVKNFELPLPDIAQQDSLVKQFDTAAEMWRIIEGGLERSIEFLTEYKQSLITAAVTGGFDVTTASTEVPA